ncbi:hypothetical protein MXD62_19540 [Frankia sp. Mgl5]|uniref:hypothetical protein n=1 Tax=Frankia sp. Mgl5 TaxID=2933793 RepID=UPI00200EE22D|nr:hypothetical protein [Frankia sp. Mgl5]MCK9929346.1 hypothetical protein [Frankia sp. Mgl5]
MNRNQLTLGNAALRVRVAPRVIVALIEGQLLPAQWTRHGWMINPDDLDTIISKVWNWAA